MFLVEVFLIAIILYFYTTRNHDYWAKRKVKHDRPLPFFGNHLLNVLVRRSAVELSVEYYNKYKDEKIVGYFRGNTPELLIRDPYIIKRILVQDFMSFHPRAFPNIPSNKSLLNNLFFADGDYWRLLRQRFTPAFSSSRMRAMFPLMVRCTEKLHEYTESLIETGTDVYAWNLMARFTMEIIGSCGFGVDLDTIKNKNDDFISLADVFFNKTHLQIFLLNLNEVCNISKVIPGFNRINKVFRETVINMITAVREQRNFKPSGRNDFMDILLEMEAMGKLQMESLFVKNPDGSPAIVELEMDLFCITAQSFLFLVAGFDTSAQVSSTLLHRLAYHQDIQRDIQKEIDTVLAKYNNKLCYNAIEEMTLLTMSLKESMRMLPPAGITRRKCTMQYTIPGTDVTINPGVTVAIPIHALQNDPKYFDNPSEFRPERFSPEASTDAPGSVYIPFGDGPRKCPGNRLAQLQSLAGVSALLRNYNVIPSPDSKPEITVKRTSYLVQIVEGDLPLRLTRRSKINK